MRRNDYIGLLALVVFLAAGVAFVLFAPQRPEVTYAPVEVTGSSLVVAPDQQPGKLVKVSATLVRPGFVTVHHSLGEAPAALMGTSAYLPAGNYPNLEIPLQEPIAPGETYYVLMFLDDGDKVYEPGVDLPVESNGIVLKEALVL